MPTLQDKCTEASTLGKYVETAQTNKDLWIAAARRAEAPPDLAARREKLSHPRNLLVLAEDWCGDALGTVPMLARLAEQVPRLELRVLARDQHLNLMDAHLSPRGARAIPVVIVLDENYRELAWWDSRPAPLQQWMLSPEAQQLSKEDRYREVRRWYSADRGRTALQELTNLIQSTDLVEGVA